MKKFTFLTALAALLLLPSLAKAQSTDCTNAVVVTASTPFTEGFESGSMPDCWTQSGSSSTEWSVATGDYSSATGAHSGTYNAKININAYSGDKTLITPLLDLSSMSAAQITFWHVQRAWGSDVDELTVKYRTSESGTWTTLQTYTSAYSTWTEESIILPNTSATFQIAFECSSHYGYGVGLDDITIGAPPTCLAITNLNVSNITTDNATISWSDLLNDNSTTYTISYWTNNNTPTVITGISNTSYTLTNLDANTGYNFSVTANCSSTDASVPTEGSFATLCGGSTCNLTLTGGYYIQFKIYQNGALKGTYNPQGGSSTAEVCNSDPVIVVINNTSSYTAYNYSVTDLAGTVLMSGNLSSSNSITDTIATPCPTCIPPTALQIGSVTTDEIHISWTPRSDATQFIVYIGDSLVNDNVTDTFYTFTNLNANTLYTVKVQSVCTTDDSSAIVGTNVRTACGAITLPYIVDFEDAAYNGAWYPCWDSVIHAGTDPSVNDQNSPANHTPGGTYAMYLQANNSQHYNLVVSPQVPLPGNQIFVSFWARVTSSNSAWLKAGVMTNPHDTSTFIPLVQVSGNSWNEYTFTTSTLDPDATYYIAWLGYGVPSGYYSTTAFIGKFDDIIIRQDNGCNKPNMAVVDSVGPYTAYLTWTTGGATATAYDLFYGTLNNIDSAAVVTVTNLDDTVHYTLTDLLPQTTYHAWVRTACGSDSADAKYIGSFTTQLTCAPVLNATMSNISYTAAQIEWAYDTTQGFPTEGVQITVVDNNDNTVAPVVVEVEGTSHTLNNLAAGHGYTVTLRNMCQAESQMDTAAAVNVSFMTLSCSEIASDGNTNNYIPTHTYYGNTYCQMLYLASEMPNVNSINGIAFNVVTRNSTNNQNRQFDVYVRHLDTIAFNGNNYFPVDSTMLYAANVTFSTASAGWQVIPFDSTFVYNGTSNLLITINDHTNGYGTAASFASISAPNRGKYSYRDNTPWTPSIMTDGNNLNMIPAVRFVADCEVPSCFAPMLTLGTVDSTSIAVTWVSTGTESEWAIGYKAEGSNTITWADNTVTDFAYTFTDLTPNTFYTLYVGSLCNGDTLTASVSAKTSCAAISLPYSTSFEGDVVNEAPSCWTVVNSYNYGIYDYTIWDYIYVDYPAVSTGAHTGSNSLGFVSDNVSTLIASSPLPANGEALLVSFWAQTNDDGGYATLTLEAGLMTDLASASTFVPMVTLTGSNDYAIHEFVTPELSSDSTYYLAFRYNASNSYGNADVDDIEIRLDDGCHRSTNVVALGTSVDEIDVTWTNDNLTNEYAVRYRVRGTNLWTTLTNIYTTSTTLTLLDTATAYEIMIGTVCSIDTQWTVAVTAKTTCAPMVLPYSNSFENDIPGDMPACWNNSGATETDYYGNTYPSVLDEEAHTGDNALVFSYITGTSIVSSEAVPLPGDSIHVNFWAKVDNSPYYASPLIEAGVMTNPTIDTTFIPFDTVTATSYQMYEFNTSALNHNEVYYVAFRYTSSTNNYLSAYVDDINISLFEGCMYPTNLVATPSGNSVSLTWSNTGSTTNFAIQYRAAGDTTWTALNNVSTTTASISNLDASTAYEVRVGTVCGTSTLWTSTSFQTDCGLLPVPYAEDFEAYARDVMPPCWIWSSTYATHDDGGVFLKAYHGGGSEYVVLPQLDGAISKLKVEFDTKVGTIAERDGILIGVTDASGTLLAWLDTLQDPNFSRNNHFRKTVYFPSYINRIPAGAARVAFAQYRNWNEWALIDNINIEVLPDCYPVDNLVGHNLDDIENTTFTWTPMGGATQWQVYVDTMTVDIDSLANLPESLFVDVYEPSYTLPIGMIQGGGIYNFFVRSNCGQFQSTWVKNEFGAGTIIMDQATDTVTGCGFVVYDNGGPIRGYEAPSSNELVLRTENVGSQLQIFGGKFGFGTSPATLTVYDGEGTTGAVLFTYSTVDGRDTMLNTILATSTTGSLTITFSVSGNLAHTGYELYIRCTDGALCPRPTELQATMTSESTATATWTGTASNYNFYYRARNAAAWVRIPTTTNSVNLTGLTADTVYDMYVIAICSATDSSSASATRQLHTVWTNPQPECDIVTNVTVSDITVTSAKVAWTAPAGQTRWEINYGVNTVEVTTNPYTLTSLSDSTTYTVKVRALCGEGMASEWSDVTSFTTLHQHEGIDDVNASHIALFPNPASSTVTLMGIEGPATVSVVDMNGREAGKWTVNNGKLTIDVTDFAQGAYFVRIVGEQVNAIRKLIVR